jgi:hypothetical protein
MKACHQMMDTNLGYLAGVENSFLRILAGWLSSAVTHSPGIELFCRCIGMILKSPSFPLYKGGFV